MLRRSRLIRLWEARRVHRKHVQTTARVRAQQPAASAQQTQRRYRWLANIALAGLAVVIVWGAVDLVIFLTAISRNTWGTLAKAGGLTLSRVLISTVMGTIWAVPAGLAIGLSPRLSRIFQPVVQVAASFPAPMLFPIVILALAKFGVGLNYGCVVLMLLGTQWYILFNVIAGAMAIPGDLREAATSFHFSGWQKLKGLYLPASFPYLVTGWVTAAGGAWNTSIVAEYYNLNGATLSTFGLGATISKAAYERNLTMLAASCLLMSVIVVTFNRLVWKRCYKLAFTRYSLDK
jgi:NitT/TauT family transport system permease protein